MILILNPIPIPNLDLSTSDDDEQAKCENEPDHAGKMHLLLMHAYNPEINPPFVST